MFVFLVFNQLPYISSLDLFLQPFQIATRIIHGYLNNVYLVWLLVGSDVCFQCLKGVIINSSDYWKENRCALDSNLLCKYFHSVLDGEHFGSVSLNVRSTRSSSTSWHPSRQFFHSVSLLRSRSTYCP